jgi:MFS family permease
MTRMPKTTRLALLFLVFMDLAGFGMLLPDVQLRAERLGAPGWMIGVILSSMFVVQTLVSPVWGGVSDRTGRKPVIVACTLLSGIAMLVYTQSTVVWIILLSRILAGFGAANVATVQAALADSATQEERTAVMGQLGAASTTGLIVGPAIGGFLASQGGALILGGVAGLCSLIGTLAVILFVPNTRPSVQDRERKRAGWRMLQGHRVLIVLFSVASVGWFSLACLEGTFGRLLERNLGQGQLAFGLIFAYESLLSVLVQSLLVKRASDRLGDRQLLTWAFVLQGFGLAAMPFAPSLPMIVVASTVFSFGNAFLNPSINGWCSRATPENRQGELFGLLQSARSVGFVVGPVLGGAMFDWRPPAPYMLAGIASAIASIALLSLTRPNEAEIESSPA